MMSGASRKIFIQLLIVLLLVCIGFFWSLYPFSIELWLLIGTFICISIINFCIGVFIDNHNQWLSKGHRRARATEVIIPPQLFKATHDAITNEQALTNTDAYSLSAKLMDTVGHKYYRFWLSLSYVMAPLILALGLSLSMNSLQNLKNTSELGQLAQTNWLEIFTTSAGTWALLGAFFAAVAIVNARTLARTASRNIHKQAHLLTQHFNLSQKPLMHIRFISLWVVIVGAGIFALMPVLLLQGVQIQASAMQQTKVANLSETKNSLEQEIADLKATINKMQVERLELEAEKEAAEKRRDVVQSVLNRTDKDWKDEKKRADALSAKLEKAQTKVATLNKSIATLEEELSTAKNNKAQLSQTSSELTQVKNTNAELTAKLEKLKTAMEAKAARLDSLEKLEEKYTLPTLENINIVGTTFDDGRLIINSENIFAEKSSRLLPEAVPFVQTLANELATISKQLSGSNMLVIAAHTDMIPPSGDTTNTMLTNAQAQKLKREMSIYADFNLENVLPIGFGQDYMNQSFDSSEDFPNRRIEIYIVPDIKP